MVSVCADVHVRSCVCAGVCGRVSVQCASVSLTSPVEASTVFEIWPMACYLPKCTSCEYVCLSFSEE